MVAMSKRLGAQQEYNIVISFGLKNGAQENSASAHLTLYSACMESTVGMCRHSVRYLLPLVLGGLWFDKLCGVCELCLGIGCVPVDRLVNIVWRIPL